MKGIILISMLLTFCSCQGQVKTNANEPFQVSHPERFKDYWFAGSGELSTYDITQNIYGKERAGETILIYVTEEFLPDLQVKKEFGEDSGVSILKMNRISRFVTGIYDYSLMSSTYTPVDYRQYPVSLKVNCTTQDWCGQTFSQLNNRDDRIDFELRSYFQSEADQTAGLEATYLENDIWTRIRLEPQMLPLGKFSMIPSLESMRLLHQECKAYEATANLVLQVNADEDEFYIYTLKYPQLNRELIIRCQAYFPFKVLSWEEKVNSKRSSGVLKKTVQLPYWQLNSQNNESYRDSLQLKINSY